MPMPIKAPAKELGLVDLGEDPYGTPHLLCGRTFRVGLKDGILYWWCNGLICRRIVRRAVIPNTKYMVDGKKFTTDLSDV